MERNDKLKRLEYWVKARIGKIAFIDVEEKRPKEWYGNGYGGFYVDPSLVPDNAIVYSFGIGEDISFDKAIIANMEPRFLVSTLPRNLSITCVIMKLQNSFISILLDWAKKRRWLPSFFPKIRSMFPEVFTTIALLMNTIL